MAKDLIIGGASNYGWNELKYWVNSIKKTGFKGDVVLVATNITKETIDKLTSEGVILELYGKQQEDGNVVAHSNNAPHVERFFYIWNFLNKTKEDYQFVVATDTRDVIFQSDPAVWFDDCMFGGYKAIIASSEGIRYKDEPWGNKNFHDCFGPFFHNIYKDSVIYNVGVLAGEKKEIQDLILMIFQMSINRPISIVDQAVYNFLINHEPYKTFTLFADNSYAWAAQLGTTKHAILSGSGDIGKIIAKDSSKLSEYESLYQDKQPTITDDGTVVNHNGTPFVIVHQYDRVSGISDLVKARFDDEK